MPRRQPKSEAAISVDLARESGDWTFVVGAEQVIQSAADAVARAAAVCSGAHSVAIALSSDADVAKLNGKYRGKAKATNVLSFAAGRGAAPEFLGDIVMAAETIAREAAEQETPAAHHVQHLVVHGLLHLFGYDHDNETEAERMEALEITILSGLGVANPYTGALEDGTVGAHGDAPVKSGT